jgi:hypothetical protein
MVTQERKKQNVIAALRAGASNYIVKPFTKQVFGKKVGPLLEKRPTAEPEPAGRLFGNLSDTRALEVVQLIAMTKKTGVLEFEAAGRRFRLFFMDGQVDHAEGEGLSGEEAFNAAAALEEGVFSFRTGLPEHAVTVRRPTNVIMLDALRQGASG